MLDAQITLDRFTLTGGPLSESTSSSLQRTQSKRWDETISILKSSGARISDVSPCGRVRVGSAELTCAFADLGRLPARHVPSVSSAHHVHRSNTGRRLRPTCSAAVSPDQPSSVRSYSVSERDLAGLIDLTLAELASEAASPSVSLMQRTIFIFSAHHSI